MSTVDQTEVEEAAAPQINPGAPQSAQAYLNLHDIEVCCRGRAFIVASAYVAGTGSALPPYSVQPRVD